MLRQASLTAIPLRRNTARAWATPARTWVRTVVTTRYTKDHEYVSYDDKTQIGAVYITDYAQKSLGDVVFVELPDKGSKLEQKAQMGAVESVKAASDIYAPVSGEVVEINSLLDDEPGLVNKKDTSKSWLCKIKLSDPKEMDNLLSEEDYKEHCESES